MEDQLAALTRLLDERREQNALVQMGTSIDDEWSDLPGDPSSAELPREHRLIHLLIHSWL